MRAIRGYLAGMLVVSWAAGAGGADTLTLGPTLRGAARADNFGSAVALTAALEVVVGAPLATNKNTGAVSLYDRHGGFLRSFADPGAAMDDRFGAAVAVQGSILAVGAPYDDAGAANSGAVVLFDLATGAWRKTLKSSPPRVSALFGFSLAAEGSRVLIGAPYEVGEAGAVYVYDTAADTLMRVASPSPQASAHFGWSVDFVGEQLLVGEPDADAGAGAAYLLGRTGALVHRFAGDAPGGAFGFSVAGVGENALIGAPLRDRPKVNAAGAAFLVAADGRTLHTYEEVAPGIGHRFGWTVAARGADLLVSAPRATTGGMEEAGVAYLLDSASGAVLGEFANPEPDRGDQFGGGSIPGRPLGRRALASLGPVLVIGTPQDTRNGEAGSVYVYEAPPPPDTPRCGSAAECDDHDACNGAETCATWECAPGVAPDCDDHDNCTLDSCRADTGCAHALLTGFGALDCHLVRLEAYLQANTGAFRAALSVRLQHLLSEARGNMKAAEAATTGSRQHRSLRRFTRKLKVFVRLTKRAQARGRIDRGVGDELVRLARDVRA